MSYIKIPDGYASSELGASGGVAIGKPIAPAAIKTVCENNEFMWGRFSGPLAASVFEGTNEYGSAFLFNQSFVELLEHYDPFTRKDQNPIQVGFWDIVAEESEFEDVCVWRVPPDPEARPLILSMIVSPGAFGGDVSYGWAGEAKTVAALTGTGSTFPPPPADYVQARQYEVARPDGAERTFIIAGRGGVSGIGFHSALLTRKTYQDAGNAIDTPTGSGFRHARVDNSTSGSDPRRIKATEPLTDELLNRLVDNPRILVESTPMTLRHVSAPVLNQSSDTHYAEAVHKGHAYGGAGIAADGIQQPVASLPLFSAYRQSVRVVAYWIGGADSTLRCYLSSDARVDLAPSANSRPTSADVGEDVNWVEASTEIDAGIHHFKAFVDGPHSQDFYLHSLQVIQDPA